MAQSFLISAFLRTPIALTSPLHLDGLLLAAYYRNHDAVAPDAPGLTYRDGVPLASAGYFVTSGFGGVTEIEVTRLKALPQRTKRMETIDIDPKARRADRMIDSISPYRNQISPRRALANIDRVAWQAHGDPEIALAAANSVSNIGSMHNHGFGEVDEWRIEDCQAPLDRVGWINGDGLMRRLSIETILKAYGAVPDNATRMVARQTAPYWLDEDKTEVAEPTMNQMKIHERDVEARLQA